MIRLVDIYWVAGILEGEAHFGVTNAGTHPMIQLIMTDYDIVARIRDLIDKTAVIRRFEDRRKPSYKDVYRVGFHGHQARGWLMTIYPLLSQRRRQIVRDLITNWKTSPSREINNSHQAKKRASIKRIMRKTGASFVEAHLMFRKGCRVNDSGELIRPN